MSQDTFTALVLTQENGAIHAEFRQLTNNDLPQGDVLVQVVYSSLNYKDGLNVTGKGKISRFFPMVPGIDLAGTVIESSSPEYHPGDPVVLTGWGIGERHWGGYAQHARVKSEWLVPLPHGMTLLHSMAIGTAGFTAMLAVMALEEAGVQPGEREVLVTGAAGGVGSIATALLAQRGYRVAASTGRTETHDYLRELGAATIIPRSELATPGRPLESERWAGAVDTVGGDVLARVLSATATGGAVAACGNAGGASLTTTVFPFILRGVRLIGIDSVTCPAARRRTAWERLARELPVELLDRISRVEPLSRVKELCDEIVAGQVRGRIVIDVNA
jgi:acrylyl-CoA reductase (NADPH)